MPELSLRLARETASDEDLLRLASLNTGYRFERTATGEVVVTPPAGSESSRKNGLLYAQLERWNAAGRFGYTFESSAGFRMPDSAVLSPDVSWIARARYDAIPSALRRTFAPLCPDLVIEVRSPSDDPGELLEKLQRLRRYGAAVAMLFDPDEGVTVLDPEGTHVEGRIENLEIARGVLADAALILTFSGLYD
jgi:Uma2 family endonuclease